MQQPEVNILSTRPIDQSLIERAAESHIIIEALSFIKTEALTDERVIEQIRELARTNATVVFTSMNAVEAVTAQLNDHHPDWKIFCIGHATKELVNLHFSPGSIAGTAANAGLLAAEIIKHNPPAVVFFCGDERRPELPEMLVANNIDLQEIVVYKRFFTPEKISRPYDGILFFSPSAVESFFLRNILPSRTVLFAIGDTTAGYLRERCSNPIIISNVPGKEQLVEQCIIYFTTSTHTHVSVKK